MTSSHVFHKNYLEVLNFIAENSRNEKCWCGSEKKYKQCHLNRESLPEIKKQEILENLKRIDKNTKQCLFKKFDNNCCNKIIRAHSISKSLFLKQISKNRNVYNIKFDFLNPNLEIKKESITEASIFHGFCNKHDTQLFSEFEIRPFTKSPNQLFKLAYRSLCFEIYRKLNAIEKYIYLKNNFDKGKNIFDQYHFQCKSASEIHLNKNGLEYLKHIQNILIEDMRNNTSEKMRHCLIDLKSLPFILFSTVISPEFNFKNERIQDLINSADFKVLFLNSLIFNNKGYICISWLDQHEEYATNFMNSLFAIKSKINQNLMFLVLKHTENISISPDWWGNLNDNDRNNLKISMEYHENIDKINTLPELLPEAFSYNSHSTI